MNMPWHHARYENRSHSSILKEREVWVGGGGGGWWAGKYTGIKRKDGGGKQDNNGEKKRSRRSRSHAARTESAPQNLVDWGKNIFS